jgi:probable blue pigment (indigoidine) exporter
MRAVAGRTVLAPISWGTTYVVITELLPGGRPLLVAAVRVVPSGLALLGLGRLADRWRPRGREWGQTALLALCNFAIFFPLLVVAVSRMPGGVAAAFGGTQPLLVVLMSWLIVRRRPRRVELAVGLVAVLGVSLVVLRPGADIDAVGLLAAAGANLAFSTGVVLTKRFATPANRVASTGWQLLIAGAVLAPLALVVEGRPPALDGNGVLGFAYLSLAATALAYVLWFNGIRKLPTQAPPLLGLSAPITGATMGWIILDQALSPVQLLGFAVTLTAIAYGATLGDRSEVAVASVDVPPADEAEPGSDRSGSGEAGEVDACGSSLEGKRGSSRSRPNSSRIAASAALTARR